MRGTATGSRWFVLGLTLLVCSSSTARALIVPVGGGTLSCAAHADWTMGNQHSHHTPADVILGAEYGTFAHSAHADAGAATGTIGVQTARTPSSITLTINGLASSAGGQTAVASVSGVFGETFNLTEATTVQITHTNNEDSHTLYSWLLYAGSQPQMIGAGAHTLSAGQYTLKSFNFYSQVNNFGQAPVSQTLTFAIVPEPAGAALVAVACLTLRRARHRPSHEMT
jgi:hypothetical protein